MPKKGQNRCAPEVLLADSPPQIYQLANHLRELIRAVVPDVEEAGYPGWKLRG